MHPQISTFVEGIVRVHSGDHNASTSSESVRYHTLQLLNGPLRQLHTGTMCVAEPPCSCIGPNYNIAAAWDAGS